MRRTKKWDSDSGTLTNVVAYFLKWITFQAPTEKATVKTESKNGCGVIPLVPKYAGNGSGVLPLSLLARWVRGSLLPRLPLHADNKAALETPSAFRRTEISSKPSPNGRKRGHRCSTTSRQHHTHTLSFCDRTTPMLTSYHREMLGNFPHISWQHSKIHHELKRNHNKCIYSKIILLSYTLHRCSNTRIVRIRVWYQSSADTLNAT